MAYYKLLYIFSLLIFIILDFLMGWYLRHLPPFRSDQIKKLKKAVSWLNTSSKGFFLIVNQLLTFMYWLYCTSSPYYYSLVSLQVVLDDNKFEDISERSKYLLHGDGASLWFDKSLCIVVFQDGRLGVNCEHGWADAPVVGHMMEYCLVNEYVLFHFVFTIYLIINLI